MKISGVLFVCTTISLLLSACGGTPSRAVSPSVTPRNGDPTTEIQAIVQTVTPTFVRVTITPVVFTSSDSSPLIAVSRDTNCHAGPHVAYPLVMIFKVGMTAPIVGRYAASNYWIIEYPAGSGNICWLWGEFATISGDISGVLDPVFPSPMPATATPAPGAPLPPSVLFLTCTSRLLPSNADHTVEMTVRLEWTDRSNDETGFNIYKDGSLLATVGRNYHGYANTFLIGTFFKHASFTYGVQAFNEVGASIIIESVLTICN